MRASTMEAGTPGHDGSRPEFERDAELWPAPDGLLDDATQPDSDTSARPASAPRPARRSNEPQLVRWLDAIVEQDERALAALYDATFSRVFGLVQSILRHAALAEEVVADTYFQVWRQAARFDPARGQALTWLLAIARSRAIDTLRREARFRHESLDEDAASSLSTEVGSNDNLLDLARHGSDLHKALMVLGAQPRQLVSLAFFTGLSHEEIAYQTQLPLGTVKSQIRRALLCLRRVLGEGDRAALAS